MFTRLFFINLLICIALSFCGIFWHPFLTMGKYLFYALAILSALDGTAAFVMSRTLKAKRTVQERFSLNQPNQVSVRIWFHAKQKIARLYKLESYDTIPDTFKSKSEEKMCGTGAFTYSVYPSSRGRHEFGVLRCFVKSRFLGLCEAVRFLHIHTMVKVYPTFKHLDKLETIANQSLKNGPKRIRRAGNNTNFDQIRAYVPGDEKRSINWKATARAASLMVNTYTDERSQPIIPIICAGPSMLNAYQGITLLDRATSAAVALASSAIRHYDEAGLMTVTHNGVDHYLQPQRSATTLAQILEYTYSFGHPPTHSELPLIDDPDVTDDDVDQDYIKGLNERMQACLADADLDALASYVLAHVKRRSLLVLFANFENLDVAYQVLPALKRISRKHPLVVVIFEDEGVANVAHAPYTPDARVSQKLSEKRFRAVCTDFISQQQMLISQLREENINVIYTQPDGLTSAVIQKYLELKDRAVI